MFALIAAFVIGLVACPLSPHAAGTESTNSPDRFAVSLAATQSQYVVGEPIKMIVALTNTSGDTLSAEERRDVLRGFVFEHIEVMPPRRFVRERHDLFGTTERGWEAQLSGTPLLPGDRIEAFIYPLKSFVLEGKDFSPVMTFPEPGKYYVRVVYSLPAPFVGKRSTRGKVELASNEVTLEFRGPTPDQAEILGAIQKSLAGSTVENDELMQTADDALLSEVIERYPDHPLTSYARFYLGRSLVSGRDADDPTRTGKGVEVLENLSKAAPDFRFEETRQHLAMGYYLLGRRDEANALMKTTLAARPALGDHQLFMMYRSIVEGGGSLPGLPGLQKSSSDE